MKTSGAMGCVVWEEDGWGKSTVSVGPLGMDRTTPFL